MIPSLALGVLTLFHFSLLRLGVKRGTVAGTGSDAVLGLRHTAVRADRLLCLTAPTMIAAVEIIFSRARDNANHEEFL